MDEEFESASEGESDYSISGATPAAVKEVQSPVKPVTPPTLASPVEEVKSQVKPVTPAAAPAISEPVKPTTPATSATASVPEAAAPASNAWTGWGSFLSSAVSAFSEQMQTDVDSLMVTARDLGEGLKKVTETSLDTMYNTLDPEFKSSLEGTAPASEDGVEVEGAAAKEITSPKVATNGIVQSTETVLSAIDKTMDFTSDLLGNAVLGGYRTLEAAKLGEKLTELRGNVEKSQVVNQSKQVGETIVSNGLTALEAIGSVIGMQAAQSLATQREKQLVLANDATPKNKPVKQLSLADFFEDNCGNAHLQALEMLGTEATIKVNGFSSEAKEKTAEHLSALDKNMDMDEVLEDLTDLESSYLSTDVGLERALSLLKNANVNNPTQIKNLVKSLELDKTAYFEAVAACEACVDAAETLQTYSRSVANLHTLYYKACADFSEKSCEQILRIAEIFLMLIAEDRLSDSHEKKEQFLDTVGKRSITFSSAIRELVVLLLSELSFVSSQYSAVMNQIYAPLKDQLDDEDKFHAAKKNFLDDVSTTTGSSLAYVQEAINSVVPILKLMVLSAA